MAEVRKLAFDLINTLDCTFQAVVARKVYSLYQRKHNGREVEMYADLLSHLLEGNLDGHGRLVLNIARRTKCTTHTNLQNGLNKGVDRYLFSNTEANIHPEIVFNVQQPTGEPLLNLADYFCWAVHRVFEKGETRFYEYIQEKAMSVVDLYGDIEEDKKFYSPINPLTKENWIK